MPETVVGRKFFNMKNYNIYNTFNLNCKYKIGFYDNTLPYKELIAKIEFMNSSSIFARSDDNCAWIIPINFIKFMYPY